MLHLGHSIASGGHAAVVAGVIVAAIGVPAVAGAWTDGAVRRSRRLEEGLGGYGRGTYRGRRGIPFATSASTEWNSGHSHIT